MTDPLNTFCEGGCACGSVRYRVISEPLVVQACHCRFCQRQTGSSNVVNAQIEADHVILLSGQIEETLLDTPSGHGQRVARCASCKVAVWSNYLVIVENYFPIWKTKKTQYKYEQYK